MVLEMKGNDGDPMRDSVFRGGDLSSSFEPPAFASVPSGASLREPRVLGVSRISTASVGFESIGCCM